jgi:methyl-galactoside transport system substrate-binding protein
MEGKMKKSKKILIITLVILMISAILVDYGRNIVMANSIVIEGQSVKIAQISKELTDDYIVSIDHYLEDIPKNKIKVEFSFYDSKSDSEIQDKNIEKVLDGGVDLILLDIVDTRTTQDSINKIKQYNIPVIMFNREPLTMEPLRSYNKALYIGTESKQAGDLQGKMLVNAWNSNKESIDKNKDNIMQYIMLQGERYNKVAIERTKYAVSTIEQAGIQTEELELRVCDWNTDVARMVTEGLLLKYGDKIEVIISNDDTMAIGAIQSLQAYGYNKEASTRIIPVVGVDAIPEVRDLIQKGFMLGSVDQNPMDYAQALYTCGMNLVERKSAIEGTQYKFDDTEVAIRIPYQEYISGSINN